MVFLQIKYSSKNLANSKVVISYNYFRQYLELVLDDTSFKKKCCSKFSTGDHSPEIPVRGQTQLADTDSKLSREHFGSIKNLKWTIHCMFQSLDKNRCLFDCRAQWPNICCECFIMSCHGIKGATHLKLCRFFNLLWRHISKLGNSKFGYSIWENIAEFGFVGPPLIRRSLDYISGLLAPRCNLTSG